MLRTVSVFIVFSTAMTAATAGLLASGAGES